MESRFQAEFLPSDFGAELVLSDPPAASTASADFFRVVSLTGFFHRSV